MISAALTKETASADSRGRPEARKVEPEGRFAHAQAVDRHRQHLDDEADRHDDRQLNDEMWMFMLCAIAA